jgi:polar amino acid transport system permease protein
MPVPAVEHRSVWQRPSTWLGVAAALVVLVGLYALGTRELTFGTDVSPDPALKWDWAFVVSLIPDMLNALSVTAFATVYGFIVAVVLGFFLALGRRSDSRWISWPVTAFIEFVRSTPLLIQLYFLFYGLSAATSITFTSNQALIIGLGIHYATYCSEAYRAGINSVPNGQWEAATAMNLKPSTTWVRVIIPQAVPNALPALGNYLVAGFKDAPLGFAINVTGLMFFATTIRAREFRPIEPFLMIGVGFLLVSIPAAWLIRRLERRISYERI